jgi:hypothetical protein
MRGSLSGSGYSTTAVTMLPDDARRALRNLNHALIDARTVIERWPTETPIWPLPEWQATLDDMIKEVIKYQGPDALTDGDGSGQC